jgi:hypothetical protein
MPSPLCLVDGYAVVLQSSSSQKQKKNTTTFTTDFAPNNVDPPMGCGLWGGGGGLRLGGGALHTVVAGALYGPGLYTGLS